MLKGMIMMMVAVIPFVHTVVNDGVSPSGSLDPHPGRGDGNPENVRDCLRAYSKL